VARDKKLNLENGEASHTLGGEGSGKLRGGKRFVSGRGVCVCVKR
jgi:hypothetical protein